MRGELDTALREGIGISSSLFPEEDGKESSSQLSTLVSGTPMR